jgi:hypothetical protein
MSKLPKMLGSADAPYIVSLMRLIETQSKTTLCNWSIDYAEKTVLPIYQRHCPDDSRPRHAIALAHNWLNGMAKFPEVRHSLDYRSPAQTSIIAFCADHAIRQAIFTIHVPMHSLRFAFYGAAAVAYDRVGINETAEIYDKIAEEFCANYEAALSDIAVKDEQNLANINWKNWLR